MVREDDESPFEGMDFGEAQEYLYDIIGFLPGESYDQTAHALFWDYAYNDDLSIDERTEKLNELADYLEDEYDIYFFDYFDWDDFRAWYAEQ